LHSSKTGNFYRNGESEDHLYLVEGTIDQIEDMNKEKFGDRESVQNHYQTKDVNVVSGYQKIYSSILETKETRAYRDHYHWWNGNNRKPESGKVFLVDPSDKDTLQIFFDDNVIMEGNNNGIIDLRHVNGSSLNMDEHLGVFVHHVEALHSIMDEDYFYNLVKKSLNSFK
jgi:hypothetical protein